MKKTCKSGRYFSKMWCLDLSIIMNYGSRNPEFVSVILIIIKACVGMTFSCLDIPVVLVKTFMIWISKIFMSGYVLLFTGSNKAGDHFALVLVNWMLNFKLDSYATIYKPFFLSHKSQKGLFKNFLDLF